MILKVSRGETLIEDNDLFLLISRYLLIMVNHAWYDVLVLGILYLFDFILYMLNCKYCILVRIDKKPDVVFITFDIQF